MTPIQFAKAFALADAHAHAWAREPRVTELLTGGGITPSVELVEAIMASVEKARPPLLQNRGGIEAPVVVDDKVIHTTLKGRLNWEVETNGAVWLTVSRPGVPELIRICVSAEGKVNLFRFAGEIFHRHVNAVLGCLSVVATPDELEKVSNTLFGVAHPDPADMEGGRQ